MSKRVSMIGLLGLSLITLVGTAARAHYQGYIGGVHYSSLACTVDIKSVPNPDQHPAVVECVVTTAVVEILCQNPAGHDVQPGASATQVTLVAINPIDPGDITDKKKGRAHVEVDVDDTPLLQDEFCVNPNWHAIDVLIRSTTAQINISACVGPNTDPDTTADECAVLNLTSTAQANCTLPAAFNFRDYPNNLPPIGTPYNCGNGFVFTHVD